MSVIDGGSFKCSQHDTLYETTNPAEWEAHVAEEHTDSGTSVCAICGKPTSYEHKPKNLKPMCADCREAYSK
jgi:hypothetical protein